MTDELERLAREAQGVGWNWSQGDPVSRYIAAASPDVILALLEERRVLREALRRLASWDEMAGHGDPAEFPPLYRAEIAVRINVAEAALQAEPARAEEGAS